MSDNVWTVFIRFRDRRATMPAAIRPKKRVQIISVRKIGRRNDAGILLMLKAGRLHSSSQISDHPVNQSTNKA